MKIYTLLINVALPSLTHSWAWDLFFPDRHDFRWYEAGASRLAADYFDGQFGSGAPGFFVGSTNHFDMNSFLTGSNSAYFNPRWQRTLGRNIRNSEAHPLNARFHWSDIPINMIFNGGLGLLGFWW